MIGLYILIYTNMTTEKYNKFFKLFMRFLKEEHQYCAMKRYLFSNRGKKQFKNDIERSSIDIFGITMLLYVTEVLGHTYKKNGYEHWVKHVKPTAEKWCKYCYDNNIKYHDFT